MLEEEFSLFCDKFWLWGKFHVSSGPRFFCCVCVWGGGGGGSRGDFIILDELTNPIFNSGELI